MLNINIKELIETSYRSELERLEKHVNTLITQNKELEEKIQKQETLYNIESLSFTKKQELLKYQLHQLETILQEMIIGREVDTEFPYQYIVFLTCYVRGCRDSDYSEIRIDEMYNLCSDEIDLALKTAEFEQFANNYPFHKLDSKDDYRYEMAVLKIESIKNPQAYLNSLGDTTMEDIKKYNTQI